MVQLGNSSIKLLGPWQSLVCGSGALQEGEPQCGRHGLKVTGKEKWLSTPRSQILLNVTKPLLLQPWI